MVPLFVQVLVTVIARYFMPWRDAARIGLAVMFLFTGVSHFSSMKYEMAQMIPPPFTGSIALIYVTGLMEIGGGIALVAQRWHRPAALSLAALLVVLFPANVYAALAGVTLGGNPATPLWLRGPLQLFWILTLLWVGRSHQESSAKRLVWRDGVL